MDKFIVEADELNDETEEHNDDDVFQPVVKRHKSAHMVTFLFWCATLISFIDRYSLSGVLSEGKRLVIFFSVHLHRYTRAIHKKTTQIVKLYFNVGNTEVAVLQTVFVISYIIFAPIIGYFGDKCNRKWILIMGILLQVASILAGSFVVDSFNQLLVTRIALGIAECILNVVCFPFVSDLYPASSRSMIIQVRTYIRTHLVVNP